MSQCLDSQAFPARASPPSVRNREPPRLEDGQIFPQTSPLQRKIQQRMDIAQRERRTVRAVKQMARTVRVASRRAPVAVLNSRAQDSPVATIPAIRSISIIAPFPPRKRDDPPLSKASDSAGEEMDRTSRFPPSPRFRPGKGDVPVRPKRTTDVRSAQGTRPAESYIRTFDVVDMPVRAAPEPSRARRPGRVRRASARSEPPNSLRFRHSLSRWPRVPRGSSRLRYCRTLSDTAFPPRQ